MADLSVDHTDNPGSLSGTIYFHSRAVLSVECVGEEQYTIFGKYSLLVDDRGVEQFLANHALPNPLSWRLPPEEQQDLAGDSAWTLELSNGGFLSITTPLVDPRRRLAHWRIVREIKAPSS